MEGPSSGKTAGWMDKLWLADKALRLALVCS